MADVVGWLVYRKTPRALLGPFPTFERAVEIAEEAGVDYRIGYGLRRGADVDFTPFPEPEEP